MQQINFIQLAIGLAVSGYLVSQKLTLQSAKKIWGSLILIGTVLLLVVIVFPTDEISSTPLLSMDLTAAGVIHLFALALFFLIAPYGVYILKKEFKKEPVFSQVAHLTGYIGYLLCVMCFLWTFFLLTGFLLPYLGIFQKIIAIITLFWLVKILFVLHIPFQNSVK